MISPSRNEIKPELGNGSEQPLRIIHNKHELSSYLKSVTKQFVRRLNPDQPEDQQEQSPTPVSLKSALSRTDFDATSTGAQLEPTGNDARANGSNNDLSTLPETKVAERVPREITVKEFVAVPHVVDVWKMHLMKGESVSTIALNMQPKHFRSGYVAWKILKHYFPDDVRLDLYKKPQTRREYAEIWSLVDLVLQKHNLTRIPVEVVSAVLDGHQAGQAILLMILYETLTNLKLHHPIPKLRYRGIFNPRTPAAQRKHRWRFTKATRSHGALPYAVMLRQLFTTNQHLAFARSHRHLRPPSFYRPLVSKHGLTDEDGENSVVSRLTRPTTGARCHVFHVDRERYLHLVPKPDPNKNFVAVLKQPFFANPDPFVKQYRVPVVKVPWTSLKPPENGSAVSDAMQAQL